MFLEKNTIRKPDSPRYQSTKPWLFNNSLRSKNHYVPEFKTFNKIDHLSSHEDIKQGYIYASYDKSTKTFTFVFKHAPGIYRAYGFLEGSVDIPLPELYIYGSLRFGQSENGTFSIIDEEIALGSPWLSVLPLSNIYTDRAEPWPCPTTSNGETIYYAPMCSGSILYNRTRNSTSPLEIINKCASYFTAFLLNHGNTDLSLYSYDTDSECDEDDEEYHPRTITGREIGRILADRSTEDFTRQATAEAYQNYWLFLNQIKDMDTPNNIYARIRKHNNFDDVLDEFNLSIIDVSEYYCDYQSSETPLIMRRNYD